MDALTTPSNWQRVRLGDIANYLTSNLSAEQITQQGKIKVYDVNNFIGYTNTTFISDKPYISIVKDGSVGRVRILPPKTNILSTMGALIANHKTTTEFLFYLLSNFDFKNFTSGSIIPHIYFKDYKEKTIFLPPLNEQIAIANILSDLDHYLYTLDALILKKESVKKALSFELLSQRKRLKGFNQAWQRVRLGDILSYEQPTKYLVATTQYLQKGFTPILTAGKTFILGYTNDKHGIYTNIPVIIFDDFTTDSKMVNFPFKVKSSAIKILSLRDNNQADLKYIYEKLTLLKHQVTDHKRYWIDEFSNFEIPLPPLNEQIAIANILSDLDHEIISLKNKKRQFENIKKALNHDLMSAKIRVLKK
ncbi:restriction endonuclease subunit S [Helicobacter pylori]|nr:restriction endonuclease subunit S [Helicobacter pylori]